MPRHLLAVAALWAGLLGPALAQDMCNWDAVRGTPKTTLTIAHTCIATDLL